MQHEPFYDPKKSYEENYDQGPFGLFFKPKKYEVTGEPNCSFLGQLVFVPFGIPAGPLPNSRFVKAALDMGFDLPVYKTVRTRKYPCHPWPNVIGVELKGALTSEKIRSGLLAKDNYAAPLSITNSFGVPSSDPAIWQKDLAESVSYAKKGQVVIGSFQGTRERGEAESCFIADFVLGAKLIKETEAKILEINFSCPNEKTPDLVCFNSELVHKICEAVKNEIGATPLIIKLAYFEDENNLRKLVEKVGQLVDGIAAINTLPCKIQDRSGNQALPGEGRLFSGICGDGVRWAGLDMTKKLKKLRQELGLSYTIIGVGGVSTPKDYRDYIASGADAVMSATGAMWNPLLAQEIKKMLRE